MTKGKRFFSTETGASGSIQRKIVGNIYTVEMPLINKDIKELVAFESNLDPELKTKIPLELLENLHLMETYTVLIGHFVEFYRKYPALREQAPYKLQFQEPFLQAMKDTGKAMATLKADIAHYEKTQGMSFAEKVAFYRSNKETV